MKPLRFFSSLLFSLTFLIEQDIPALIREALKIFYGGLPPASLNESIKAYEKAKQIEPDFALNYLELAKAYKKNNQKDKAIELLKKTRNHARKD